MRGLLREQGLEDAVEVDSAGTGDWHAGAPPDARATAAAARARRDARRAPRGMVAPRDFEDYDLILAADRSNLRDLRGGRPDAARARACTCCASSTRTSEGAPDLDVPDPYYGERDGFERVLDLVEAACRGLLDDLRAAGRL